MAGSETEQFAQLVPRQVHSVRRQDFCKFLIAGDQETVIMLAGDGCDRLSELFPLRMMVIAQNNKGTLWQRANDGRGVRLSFVVRQEQTGRQRGRCDARACGAVLSVETVSDT